MLGAFLLAEGLAEPVDDGEPALIIPMRELPRRGLEDRLSLAADMARGVRAPAARPRRPRPPTRSGRT